MLCSGQGRGNERLDDGGQLNSTRYLFYRPSFLILWPKKSGYMNTCTAEVCPRGHRSRFLGVFRLAPALARCSRACGLPRFPRPLVLPAS